VWYEFLGAIVDGRLCNPTCPMSSNDLNPPNSSPDGTGFKTIDTVSAAESPPSEVLSCILEYEEAGVPLVIVGLSADPDWLPFPQPRLSEAEVGGGVERQWPGVLSHLIPDAERQSNVYKTDRDERRGCQPSVFTWASGLSLIPKYLLPHGPRETLSMTVEDLQNEGDLSGAGATISL
jgi:hypothetical protein